MAWYKPGRDGPSRTSRLKVWAPMGRAGCLVLVVAVIVGVVIALMIVATRTAGAAGGTDGPATTPESVGPPSFGQRVEVSEAGFALTFPVGKSRAMSPARYTCTVLAPGRRSATAPWPIAPRRACRGDLRHLCPGRHEPTLTSRRQVETAARSGRR
jgi:hypothetical protein